jgi:ribosome maturation factor RimP
MGSNVAVHLYRAKNGKKEYVGRLTTYNNGDLEIEVNGAPVSFKKDEVALVRLRISL